MRSTVAVVALAAVAACTGPTTPAEVPARPSVPPAAVPAEDYMLAGWTDTLGGDDGAPDLATLATTTDIATVADADTLRTLATQTITAEATGERLDRLPDGYLPDGMGVADGAYLPGTDTCRDVTVVAASPARLPVVVTDGTVDTDSWAKILVAWHGACPDPSPVTDANAGLTISYVYAARTGDAWQVIRPGRIPHPLDGPPSGVLAEWAREPLTGCTRTPLTARMEVAWAWNELCAAATAAGVPLEAVDGWRDAHDQAQRFADAVEYYGSEAAARRYVAEADASSCASAHCAGEAIDVNPDPVTNAWLTETVACVAAGNATPPDGTGCPAGATPATRAATFGFTLPLPVAPGHLEYAGPLADLDTGDGLDCDPPPSRSVPDVIAKVWACRLTTAGITATAADVEVARALVVARCASGWDPAAVAFAGRYRSAPHPAIGRPYDGEGVFQIPPAWFAAFDATHRITDAAANADVAARIYLRERELGRWGWDPFPCAAANDGIVTGSVLPERGGDPLPGWATAYR